MGIEDNTFVMISVGGCSNIKRHTEIINALPLINNKIKKCLYLHLGKGESESDEIKLAGVLGISDNIIFSGNQSDVRKFLIASDVYIMPSRFEGIPITTIEAMACKIPCILYNVPGLRDFNSTGENCILIPEDFKILVEKIIYVKNNPTIALAMAAQACEFVNKYFDMKNNVNKILELYK